MKIWGVLTFLMLLFSCSKNHQFGDEQRKPLLSAQISTISDLDEKVSNFRFIEANIPQYLGMILSLKDSFGLNSEYGFCNGSLIDENIVITNRHCIHESFIQNPDQCEKHFRIVFHAHNQNYVGRCKRVLDSSTVGDKRDYAVIELTQELPLAPIRLNIEGIVDYMMLKVTALNAFDDEESNNIMIQLHYVLCSSRYNPIWDYYGEFDPMITMISPFGSWKTCDPYFGNSGAMVTNGKGEGIAIFQGASEAKKMDDPLARKLLEQAQKVGLATNIASIAFFNPSIEYQPYYMEEKRQLYDDQWGKKLILDVFPKFDEYEEALQYILFDVEDHNFFDTLTKRGTVKRDFTLVPKCIDSFYKAEDLPSEIEIPMGHLSDAYFSMNDQLEYHVGSPNLPGDIVKVYSAILKTDSDGAFYEFEYLDNQNTKMLKKIIRYCEDRF